MSKTVSSFPENQTPSVNDWLVSSSYAAPDALQKIRVLTLKNELTNQLNDWVYVDATRSPFSAAIGTQNLINTIPGEVVIDFNTPSRFGETIVCGFDGLTNSVTVRSNLVINDQSTTQVFESAFAWSQVKFVYDQGAQRWAMFFFSRGTDSGAPTSEATPQMRCFQTESARLGISIPHSFSTGEIVNGGIS